MSDFIERQINVDLVKEAEKKGLKKCDIPINRIFNETTNDVSPAAKYIKVDTDEYYHLASDQYTVLSDQNILTEKGLKLFNETQEKYNRGEWKDILEPYGIMNSLSGFWSPDKSSKYYTDDEKYTCLNTRNNLKISGFSKKKNDCLTTSVVIFVTDNWCLTNSGSLYKLVKKLPIYEIFSLVKK